MIDEIDVTWVDTGDKSDMPTSQNGKNQGLPERLKQLRKQKNLSQQELAELAEIHYTHIGRYERGQSKPSTDTLKRVADALGVSSDYLLEGSTDAAAKATFEDRDLLRQFQELQSLDDKDKEIVKALIEAFIARKKIQQLVGT